MGTKYIEFTYDAAGVKWKKTTVDGAVTTEKYYFGSIEYNGANLEAIYHEEGRAAYISSNFEYQYAIRDHLGNTRVMFKMAGGTPTILQENHYYPFGMEMQGSSFVGGTNPYRYNSKEFNDDFGLSWSDYGARWYDGGSGRFTTIDRFAEKYYPMTPFGYAANNPISFIDVNGDSIVVHGSDNSIIYVPGMEYSGDDHFIKQTIVALDYLVNEFDGTLLGQLSDLVTSETFTLDISLGAVGTTIDAFGKEVEIDTRFQTRRTSIFGGDVMITHNNEWGSKFGENQDILRSPALNLLHELGHARNLMYDKTHGTNYVKTREGTPIPGFDNLEEMFTTNAYENAAAIKSGLKIRTDHKPGVYYRTISPVSTTPKN